MLKIHFLPEALADLSKIYIFSPKYWFFYHSYPNLMEDLPKQPEARPEGSCGESCGLHN